VNKIPYANLGSPYGKGELMDFIHRLNYVIEKPIYLLLIIGSVSLVYSFFRHGLKKYNHIKVLLIFGSFVTIFVAHSIFWWLGIFNSMGLARVLIAVVPLIALIALIGFQTLSSKIRNPVIKYSLLGGFLLVICFYPFTKRPQGVVFNDKLFVLEENRLIDEELAPYLEKEFPDYSDGTLYFSHPYLSLALDIDYFDTKKHREMQYLLTEKVDGGAIIIWDEWFSVIEGGVGLDKLTSDKRFQFMQSFQRKDNDRMIRFSVFKAKADYQVE